MRKAELHILKQYVTINQLHRAASQQLIGHFGMDRTRHVISNELIQRAQEFNDQFDLP